ncbi:hypothetical protein KJ682_09475 [bacterium]|nr:hypothetical protein [bacterium]
MIKRHGVVAFGLCALVAAVAAQATVPVLIEWESCPDEGFLLKAGGETVQYGILLGKEDGSEELVAMTADTLYTLRIDPGSTVRVCVQGLDAEGNPTVRSEWSEPLLFSADDEIPGGVPFLQPNYPNPFNPATTLTYLIPEDLEPGAPVRMEVFTVRGARVRTLDLERSPGWHQVRWDGTDDAGQRTASGTYLARYLVGTMVETRKMVMLK